MPFSELLSKSRISSIERDPSDAGMVPVSALLSMSISTILSSKESSEGIRPVSWCSSVAKVKDRSIERYCKKVGERENKREIKGVG